MSLVHGKFALRLDKPFLTQTGFDENPPFDLHVFHRITVVRVQIRTSLLSGGSLFYTLLKRAVRTDA